MTAYQLEFIYGRTYQRGKPEPCWMVFRGQLVHFKSQFRLARELDVCPEVMSRWFSSRPNGIGRIRGILVGRECDRDLNRQKISAEILATRPENVRALPERGMLMASHNEGVHSWLAQV